MDAFRLKDEWQVCWRWEQASHELTGRENVYLRNGAILGMSKAEIKGSLMKLSFAEVEKF